MGSFETGAIIDGRYEVERRLGRGGMGVVYLVFDQEMDRRVALKTILPQFTERKTVLRRFVREVKTVRRMDHPCIVKIYEAHSKKGLVYFTMEYVEGKSLRKLMEDRKHFGLGSTVRIISLLCHALEHAHQHTIHRDVSPENVLVTKDGHVKLVDFGLAKLARNAPDFTKVNMKLGKRYYSAPEQRADAKNVDVRADIYSLGIMFFEMLSGQLPSTTIPLSVFVPDLHPDWDSFVSTATADDPEERFPTVRDVRKAIAHIYDATQEVDGEVQELKSEFGKKPPAASEARFLKGMKASLDRMRGRRSSE